MANGYKLDKGFLVDKKWEKQLRRLKPSQFHRLFWDLYDLQMNGGTIPEYDDPIMDCIADFASEHIQHRLNGAMRGGTPPPTPEGTPPPTIPREEGGTPPKAKTKTKAKAKAITPPTPSEGGEVCAKRFAEFWDAYPRKEGKERARQAFKKLGPDEDLLQRMLEAIELQKASDQWTREDGKYIPHPATWLNGKRWEDEVKPATRDVSFFDILRDA